MLASSEAFSALYISSCFLALLSRLVSCSQQSAITKTSRWTTIPWQHGMDLGEEAQRKMVCVAYLLQHFGEFLLTSGLLVQQPQHLLPVVRSGRANVNTDI
jgi:hypothetical protein